MSKQDPAADPLTGLVFKVFPSKMLLQPVAYMKKTSMGLVKAITPRRLMNGIRKPICGCLTQ